MRSICGYLSLLLILSTLAARTQTTIDSSLVMSDGVHLETTLVLPADSLRPPAGFPTVVYVHGLGGDKDGSAVIGTVIAGNGFASLMYSVRGQGKSGGLSTIMGPREVQDLQTVVAYLRTRPGINPDAIGIAGGSQGGVHAWIAAINRIPGVRCIATLLAPPSYASDLAPNNTIKQQLQTELSLGSVRYDPIRDRVRSFVFTENMDSIRAFMMQRDLARHVDSVTIPVIQSLGWADVIFPANGAIRARAQLAARGIPIWSYFGTNGHSEPINVQEYLFTVQMMLDWFHHWLEAPKLPDVATPWVTFADDSPAWPHRETAVWPPAPASTLRLYPGGYAPGDSSAGFLTLSPPSMASSHPFSLVHDPAYTSERAWNESYSGAAFLNAFRSTPVRFRSVQLVDTLDVTGIPRAHLQLRGDGGSFQANIRLFDITPHPDGESWKLLTHMPLGVRSANSSLDETYEAEGEALSHKLPPSHYLGIEISSLDMWDATRAHIIPYFRSSTAVLTAGPGGISYIDIPFIGSAAFVTSTPSQQVQIPSAFVLHQNYPNPFNPSTTLRFDLASAQEVGLEVYNVTGQRVATLVNGIMPPGSHAVPFQARDLASGVYYYRLMTMAGSSVRSMVLLR
jgi:predicted acyl esterase